MLCLTCTTITSVDLAHYGVSCAKDWVSVYCGTIAPYERFYCWGNRKTGIVDDRNLIVRSKFFLHNKNMDRAGYEALPLKINGLFSL